MKEQTKQKRGLKNEVYEILSSYDLSGLPTYERVDELLNECGKQISEILSDYFLRWESMNSMRGDILENLENNYDLIPKKVIRLLLIEFIKEYYNSDEFKNRFSISEFIAIEDVCY
jgi:hypothetical protein